MPICGDIGSECWNESIYEMVMDGVSKVCQHCNQIKPLDCFVKSPTSEDGRRNCCRACKNAEERQWKKDHSELAKSRHDRYYFTLKGCLEKKVYDSVRRAKQYDLQCDITLDSMLDLYKQQDGRCLLTNIPLQYDKDASVVGTFKPYSISIDRIDSGKGYRQDNVRLVCLAVNFALNEFGDQVFDSIMLCLLNNAHIPYAPPSTRYVVKSSWYNHYRLTPEGRMYMLLNGIRSRVKRDETSCDLTQDWLTEMYSQQNGQCALTGIKFDLSRPGLNQVHPYGPSIDRIDPEKGYTTDNVRIANIAINIALNQFGESTVRHIATCYKNFRYPS